MEERQISNEGSKVTFKSHLSGKNPETVMVPSAMTRASVPASVDNKPPLNVPLDSLEDITLDRSDKFTPSSTSADTKVIKADATY